ncbi:MAG: diaminopropionate ammonia-lyase [Sphingopyxis sp.]|uniref:diaminopropionate ammonia-lyase n=1 Tax=Sphingopyxis sp. TaxID=1908224 RepID=UPI001A27D681|nr:diaminopropionate ammonia-lyase [Sphingopyxis sp.]MBJ7499828.1 diaminopropionate ammonia-lyase [Sphingopyxis sp.]
MQIHINELASRAPYSDAERAVTSLEDARDALAEVGRWPRYAPTPLRELPGMASELGLAKVWMKDESQRLGQNSFKSLGGAYAATLKVSDMADKQNIVLCTATEGNHGRSVAYAAQRLGCKAVIFMQEHALDYKVAAIEALGATVIRSPGNYDDSVVIAAAAAEKNGWLLISDTNDASDRTVHHVMHGYGIMALELLDQFEPARFPTHVFLQAGVGGLAAGVIGVLSEKLGAARPQFVVVEPETAACVLASAREGRPAQLKGDVSTVMQMLAVGNASPAAWPILSIRADAFITVRDDEAIRIRQRLLMGEFGLTSHDIGLSGVAGLTGLHTLIGHSSEAAERLGLGPDSRVLVFGTEAGPTTATATAPADEQAALQR